MCILHIPEQRGSGMWFSSRDFMSFITAAKKFAATLVETLLPAKTMETQRARLREMQRARLMPVASNRCDLPRSYTFSHARASKTRSVRPATWAYLSAQDNWN